MLFFLNHSASSTDYAVVFYNFAEHAHLLAPDVHDTLQHIGRLTTGTKSHDWPLVPELQKAAAGSRKWAQGPTGKPQTPFVSVSLLSFSNHNETYCRPVGSCTIAATIVIRCVDERSEASATDICNDCITQRQNHKPQTTNHKQIRVSTTTLPSSHCLNHARA